jgi:hypothetical protein
MSAVLSFIKSEPVVVWIGLIDAVLMALVNFNVIPGLSLDQKASVDVIAQLLLAIVVRTQVMPSSGAAAAKAP